MTTKQIFDEFLTSNIKEEILRHTTRKGAQLVLHFNIDHEKDIAIGEIQPREFIVITSNELEAFIGVLFMMGLHGSNDDSVLSLWNNYGHYLYKASMSRDRFKTILRVIRFDNADTRKELIID